MSRFLRRTKENKAHAITIMGLFMILLIILLGVFIVDFTKNFHFKQTFNSAAQAAAKTAIKSQNLTGGLSHSAVGKAIDEYRSQRTGRDASGEIRAHQTKCMKAGYPIIEIRMDTERRLGGGTLIYKSVGFSKPAPLNSLSSLQFDRQKYTTIEITVTDVIDNYFMGAIGMPCSYVSTRSSAIISSAFDEDGGPIN